MIKFIRENFFPKKKIYSSNDISKILLKNTINEKIINNFKILDISSLNSLKENSILLLDKKIILSEFNFKNILLITDNADIFNNNETKNCIYVNNLSESWNIITNHIYSHEDQLDYEDHGTPADMGYIGSIREWTNVNNLEVAQ